VAVYTLDKIW